jgi:hypothetical protein
MQYTRFQYNTRSFDKMRSQTIYAITLAAALCACSVNAGPTVSWHSIYDDFTSVLSQGTSTSVAHGHTYTGCQMCADTSRWIGAGVTFHDIVVMTLDEDGVQTASPVTHTFESLNGGTGGFSRVTCAKNMFAAVRRPILAYGNGDRFVTFLNMTAGTPQNVEVVTYSNGVAGIYEPGPSAAQDVWTMASGKTVNSFLMCMGSSLTAFPGATGQHWWFYRCELRDYDENSNLIHSQTVVANRSMTAGRAPRAGISHDGTRALIIDEDYRYVMSRVNTSIDFTVTTYNMDNEDFGDTATPRLRTPSQIYRDEDLLNSTTGYDSVMHWHTGFSGFVANGGTSDTEAAIVGINPVVGGSAAPDHIHWQETTNPFGEGTGMWNSIVPMRDTRFIIGSAYNGANPDLVVHMIRNTAQGSGLVNSTSSASFKLEGVRSVFQSCPIGTEQRFILAVNVTSSSIERYTHNMRYYHRPRVNSITSGTVVEPDYNRPPADRLTTLDTAVVNITIANMGEASVARMTLIDLTFNGDEANSDAGVHWVDFTATAGTHLITVDFRNLTASTGLTVYNYTTGVDSGIRPGDYTLQFSVDTHNMYAESGYDFAHNSDAIHVHVLRSNYTRLEVTSGLLSESIGVVEDLGSTPFKGADAAPGDAIASIPGSGSSRGTGNYLLTVQGLASYYLYFAYNSVDYALAGMDAVRTGTLAPFVNSSTIVAADIARDQGVLFVVTNQSLVALELDVATETLESVAEFDITSLSLPAAQAFTFRGNLAADDGHDNWGPNPSNRKIALAIEIVPTAKPLTQALLVFTYDHTAKSFNLAQGDGIGYLTQSLHGTLSSKPMFVYSPSGFPGTMCYHVTGATFFSCRSLEARDTASDGVLLQPTYRRPPTHLHFGLGSQNSEIHAHHPPAEGADYDSFSLPDELFNLLGTGPHNPYVPASKVVSGYGAPSFKGGFFVPKDVIAQVRVSNDVGVMLFTDRVQIFSLHLGLRRGNIGNPLVLLRTYQTVFTHQTGDPTRGSCLCMCDSPRAASAIKVKSSEVRGMAVVQFVGGGHMTIEVSASRAFESDLYEGITVVSQCPFIDPSTKEHIPGTSLDTDTIGRFCGSGASNCTNGYDDISGDGTGALSASKFPHRHQIRPMKVIASEQAILDNMLAENKSLMIPIYNPNAANGSVHTGNVAVVTITPSGNVHFIGNGVGTKLSVASSSDSDNSTGWLIIALVLPGTLVLVGVISVILHKSRGSWKRMYTE